MPERPVIFVHGWATDSWVWGPVAKGCAGAARKIDLPGHGARGPWDEPTLAPAIKAIQEAVAGFSERPVGVGWSLGAMALIGAQAETRGTFSALCLVGATPCFVARDGFPWGQPRALVKRMIMDMRKDPGATVSRFYGLNFTGDEQKSATARAMMDRYAYPGPISCDGEAPGCFPSFRYDELTTALEALSRTDLRDKLSAIDVPTLIVHGDEDAICPLGAAEYLASEIAGARLEVFGKCGHAPHVTGVELFKSTLNDFIASI